MSELETHTALQIKKYDYDRFLITLFAPKAARADLFALYAFNHEIAKVREAVSEPMLGEIRLAWWREAIEGIYEDNPRDHDIVIELHKAVIRSDLPKHLFLKIIDARTADLYDENPENTAQFEEYLGQTSGNLMRLATLIIGGRDEQILDLAYDMGLVWGLIGTIRTIPYHISLNKLSLPQDLMDQYGVTKRDVFSMKDDENVKNLIMALCGAAQNYLDQIAAHKNLINKNTRSLFLLSSLSRSYLKSIKKAEYYPLKLNENADIFYRQGRLFFSALFGII